MMLKLPLWIALVILVALLACGEQTPIQGGAVATAPALAEGATSLPSLVTPAAEPTATLQETPTETTVPSAETTSLPANTQAPEATSQPTRTPEPPTPAPTSTPTPTATILMPTQTPATLTPVPTLAPEPPTPAPTSTQTPTAAIPVPTRSAPTLVPTAEPGPYYTQSVDVDGISVKASQAVDPKALVAGAETVRVMLAHRPDMARRMAEAGAALAIVPKDRYITEIPELGYLRGMLDLNGNSYDSFTVRGAGGIPQQPTTVTSEENLLGLVEDRSRFWAEDITVHEWAHAIENLGFDDETRTKWRDLFDRARAAGLWPGTFAMTVDGGREFFAELSQSFFGVNNEIGGPEALYSEGQTGIRAEIFGALEDIYGPPEEK